MIVTYPTPENNDLNIDRVLFNIAKEQPKKETEEQQAIRKKIRKEWSTMEPILIEIKN